MQSGGECWCGEWNNKFASTGECFTGGEMKTCSADPANVCGAEQALSVYRGTLFIV